MNIRFWSIALLFLILSPTVVAQRKKNYLENPLPQTWANNIPNASSINESLFSDEILPINDQWWQQFNDPILDSLIAVACNQNFDVLSAIQQIEVARTNMRIARSGFFPTIKLGAGWKRQQSSGSIIKSSPQYIESYYDAALSASWEIDVFGSIRKKFKAEKELFFASRDEYAYVMISLCAQLASAYFNLRELQQELDVTYKNCKTQEGVLKITEAQYNAGLVSKLDVVQAKSVYYNTKASVPQYEASISQYINTIAILLGVYPQDMRDALITPMPLPEYIEPIGIGIPADLLLRRPDVKKAEREVNAQAALLGATKSDWLPQIFMKGSFGYAAKDLKDFTKRKSMTFEIAPALSWTLFNGLKTINTTKQARAQLNESIISFNQTVLTAVQETDNAINNYKYTIKESVALKEVCIYGEEALRLSVELYKQGLTPFQNVLDAMKSLLEYENGLVQAKGNSLIYLVSLYQALGGGYVRASA